MTNTGGRLRVLLSRNGLRHRSLVSWSVSLTYLPAGYASQPLSYDPYVASG